MSGSACAAVFLLSSRGRHWAVNSCMNGSVKFFEEGTLRHQSLTYSSTYTENDKHGGRKLCSDTHVYIYRKRQAWKEKKKNLRSKQICCQHQQPHIFKGNCLFHQVLCKCETSCQGWDWDSPLRVSGPGIQDWDSPSTACLWPWQPNDLSA